MSVVASLMILSTFAMFLVVGKGGLVGMGGLPRQRLRHASAMIHATLLDPCHGADASRLPALGAANGDGTGLETVAAGLGITEAQLPPTVLAPNCFAAWLGRRPTVPFLPALPHALVLMRPLTEKQALQQLFQFVGASKRLGLVDGGEEARERLPAAHLSSTRGFNSGAKFAGAARRLGRSQVVSSHCQKVTRSARALIRRR